MENRERDRMSQRPSSTEAGELNRRTEGERGREQNSGTSAGFGQKIGRSENLEGGEMNNRNSEQSTKKPTGEKLGNESTRRSGIGEHDSSTGRRGSTGSMGNTGTQGGSGNIGNSSEGRH